MEIDLKFKEDAQQQLKIGVLYEYSYIKCN